MRRRGRKAGFTLVELMVALVIGALVVAAVFSLGGASARHFQEQQRVGVTQRSVRMAMDRLRRDISRAGYQHVPSNTAPNFKRCTNVPSPRPLPGVWMQNDDPVGNGALNLVNRTTNRVSADRIRLIGNYGTSNQFLITDDGGTGTAMLLQTNWHAFQQSFVFDNSGVRSANQQAFDDVFRAGRMVHIETVNDRHFFAFVSSAVIAPDGTRAVVNITPGVPTETLSSADTCTYSSTRGAVLTPLSEVEYFIDTPSAGSNLNPRAAQVVGPNTQLVRQELAMNTGTPIAGTRQVILEYAVNFDVDFFVDRNIATGLPPNIVREDDGVAQGTIQGSPWMARSAVVSLAARSPEQDRRFPWPTSWAGGRPAGAPLNRFLVFSGRPGAARVRSFTTEINMPNMVPR